MTGAARRPMASESLLWKRLRLADPSACRRTSCHRGFGDLNEARVLQKMNEMRDPPLLVAQGVCRFEHQELVAACRYELRFSAKAPGEDRRLIRSFCESCRRSSSRSDQRPPAARRRPKHGAQMRIDILDGTRRQRYAHPDRHLLDDCERSCVRQSWFCVPPAI